MLFQLEEYQFLLTLGIIMLKDKDYQLVLISKEDVTTASLIYLHGNNVEYYDKKYIVTNLEFEAIIPPI